MSADPAVLVPAVPAALDDLAVLLARAERATPAGAARLQVLGEPDARVLVVGVAPLVTGSAEDAGLPVAVGMRVLALADGTGGAGLDATVPVRALLDRLARARSHLPLPPERVLGAAWAGLSPPRGPWREVASVASAELSAVAAAGARHVAAGAPRAGAWSRPVPGADGLPAAAALAAEVLGFLVDAPPTVPVARSGPWWRLSTRAGHVLVRRPSLLS